MVIENVQNLIGTVGFPIGAFMLLYYERLTTAKELTKAVNNTVVL